MKKAIILLIPVVLLILTTGCHNYYYCPELNVNDTTETYVGDTFCIKAIDMPDCMGACFLFDDHQYMIVNSTDSSITIVPKAFSPEYHRCETKFKVEFFFKKDVNGHFYKGINSREFLLKVYRDKP